MKTNPSELKTVLVTDCGSTTTKALLFERTNDGWRQTYRGEAPTTVEAPVADVTVGAINAFTEVAELSKRDILSGVETGSPFIETGTDSTKGIDLYLSTSSAGGGLQMMVAGIASKISAESAERAALGAGAIVLDSISSDDGREDHDRIELIRHIRPDIVLLTGGIDTGATQQVIEMAEILLAASPKPRFGDTLKLPVIYAGNQSAAAEVKEILGNSAEVTVVPNVRGSLEEENLGPAREAIHEIFLSHVMSHSPGYGKLLSWTPVPIMPTPAAVGLVVESYAREQNENVLCVDIGGATTDVFSVFKDADAQPAFHRTVSANLGMSYSIANVLLEAGAENIARWLPYELPLSELRDRLRNKMIRPTSIPQTLDDLFLEQAVCREALRLSLVHHRSLAIGLGGKRKQRTISDALSQSSGREELVDMMALDVVIGSGGVLSHAPRRMDALLMMLEGFGLEGITRVVVDSIFMMPHLGIFSTVAPEAAHEILLRDCLIHVGDTIVPVYGKSMKDTLLARVVIGDKTHEIKRGEVKHISLESGKEYALEVLPSSSVNVGGGVGETVTKTITAGQCGIVTDGRNRPLSQINLSGGSSKMKDILYSLGIGA